MSISPPNDTLNLDTPEGLSPQFPPAPQQTVIAGGGSAFNGQEASGAPYSEWKMDTMYETLSGMAVLPATGANGVTGVAVKLHDPIMRKIIKATGERIGPLGSWPVMPSSDTGNPNEIKVLERVITSPPHPIGDNYAHRMYVEYHYRLLKPITTYPAGTTPVDQSTAAQNVVTQTAFDPSLANTTGVT